MRIFKQSETDEIANVLNNDGAIAVPTDTVYGLCAKMNSIKAYEKLVKIKGRPTDKAFPIMCADLKQINSIAYVDEKSSKIIKLLMPGAITILLEKKQEIPQYVNNGLKLIAIRMATSKVLEDVIKKIGCPLFMSSANFSGQPVCKSIEEIENKFPYIDGIVEGNISYGMASTIVDCTSGEIKIIREGPISLNEIKSAIMKNI